MYPYNNDPYRSDRSSPAGWDSDSGTYHYSYTQPSAPADPPEQPRKKKGGAAKVVALVLACALVGGGAGVGGAALFNALAPGSAQTGQDGGTVIYRNDTDPAPLTVNQTGGLKEMSLSEIYAAYADSCVCVTVQIPVTNNYYFYQQQYTATGAGSGFIVSEDGYIVTNYHVIDGASAISVTLNNGETYEARLIGGEELNDVAVLKVDGITGLKPVVLGDSDDLVVGETVCTIGNALGAYSFSLTSGAVSGVGRTVTMSDGTVMNMIQTDCTINNGNSGGPLFDKYGRVVGITSAKLSNNGSSSTSEATIEGMGFAIPLNDVIGIVTDFMEYGYVTGRPYMGITGFTVESSDQQRFGWPAGVYVNSVDEGSCAETAGLKQGDIITALDGTEVTSMNELASAKNRHRAGDTVELTVQRGSQTLTLTITFDEQASQAQEQPSQSGSQNGSQDNGYGDSSGNGGGQGFSPWGSFGW